MDGSVVLRQPHVCGACPVSGSIRVFGLDREAKDLNQFEHAVLGCTDDAGINPTEIATHIVSGHYVATINLDADQCAMVHRVAAAAGFTTGDNEFGSGAPPTTDAEARIRSAVFAHQHRVSGRLIRFPGYPATLVDEVTVSALLAATSIDEVVALGADLGDDAVIVANCFIRPVFQSERIVLAVTALEENRFRPYEIEHQHQCCGGH